MQDPGTFPTGRRWPPQLVRALSTRRRVDTGIATVPIRGADGRDRSLPSRRCGCGARGSGCDRRRHDGRRFRHGGTTAPSPTVGRVVSASVWRVLPSAPTARQQMASTVSGGVLWFFGGLTNGVATTRSRGMTRRSRRGRRGRICR